MTENTELTIPGVPFPFRPEGPEPASWSHADGVLTIAAAARTDLFVDPAGAAPTPPDAFRLLGTTSDGDFQLGARVRVDMDSTYDAGVLLLYADATTWAKLCLERTPLGEPSIVSVVTRGESDDANAHLLESPTSWLRITRTGRAHAFHTSEDGRGWRLVRYFALPRPARIGFLAQSPTGQGCTSTFTDFHYAPTAPADLRDGS